LYDLMKTTQATLSNPLWMGFSAEAFIFLALIYLVCCYAMSNYSRKLERELHS
ncbi:MAG TPA: amino acid ABC transporter permease, partial [Desulfobacteraceae bacterium]|nr:amino acid ABC transporter permease [Desulfobacteraceae bacterium]